MKLPEQQLEMMRNYVIPQSPIMPLFFGISFLGLLGYLLFIRKYFVPPPTQENPFQQTSI
jgi:predicted permease